jgi:hypothetical protein
LNTYGVSWRSPEAVCVIGGYAAASRAVCSILWFCAVKLQKPEQSPTRRGIAGRGFFEGIDCYMRSRTPAEEEIPPVRGFSAPERRLTGKQRPPDFSLLKKPRPIRSYSSGEQTARQAGSRRQRRSKACCRGIPDRRCSERPYGAAHRRPPDSGSGFRGGSGIAVTGLVPEKRGTRELIPGAGQTAGTGGAEIAAGGEGPSHGGAPPFYDVSEYHKSQCTARGLPL